VAPDDVGVLASPQMANEDLFALCRVLERRGIRRIGFRVPPRVPGDEDDFLIRADKHPNSLGASLLGLDGDVAAILAAARTGQVKCLWIFGHDLFASGWPEADVDRALHAVESVVFVGPNANATSERARWVLPAAAWVERDGTYTNCEGRVQRFRQALEPLGLALPEWDILGRVLVALGAPTVPPRAERWFAELATTVPAFTGLSYRSIGDVGQSTTTGTA
jgi:predicted molibdopterin-dependent oxidoreductase YjgC